jgi:uncharacterized membrane protein
MIELATLGGTSSDARYINESGQVAGWRTNVAGYDRATLWIPAGGGVLPGG